MHFKTASSKKTHFKNSPSKNAIQNCSFKKHNSKLLLQRYFVSTFINAAKDKTERDKSLIMHD